MWSPPSADEMLQRRRLRLDRGEAALDVAMGDTEIADIGNVEPRRVGPIAGWSPSTSMRLAWRIAPGPKRAPGRFEVPRS